MANGNTQDPLEFLRDLAAPGGSLSGRESIAGLAPTGPVAPEFPDTESIQAPVNKKAAILAGIGELLRTAASARGRIQRPRGPSGLDRLVHRRGQETSRLRDDALRKFSTERRDFESERGVQQGREQATFEQGLRREDIDYRTIKDREGADLTFGRNLLTSPHLVDADPALVEALQTGDPTAISEATKIVRAGARADMKKENGDRLAHEMGVRRLDQLDLGNGMLESFFLGDPQSGIPSYSDRIDKGENPDDIRQDFANRVSALSQLDEADVMDFVKKFIARQRQASPPPRPQPRSLADLLPKTPGPAERPGGPFGFPGSPFQSR